MIRILEKEYKELSNIYEPDIDFNEVEFILQGKPSIPDSNGDNNKKLKSLNEETVIDKEKILNKLNENESIRSNEIFQNIIKNALDM